MQSFNPDSFDKIKLELMNSYALAISNLFTDFNFVKKLVLLDLEKINENTNINKTTLQLQSIYKYPICLNQFTYENAKNKISLTI